MAARDPSKWHATSHQAKIGLMADMLERYVGCFLGLAAGDALGAPVEFLSLDSIRTNYGADGISDLAPWGHSKPGSYTDDTQMSLATAEGLLGAYPSGLKRGAGGPAGAVYKRYLKWARSQIEQPSQRRAPGRTCLSALYGGKMGTIESRINDSKGCGGVMRTAPVGLAFPPGLAFRYGAEIGAITHGHPSGYLPAGFISELVARILSGEDLDSAVGLAVKTLETYRGHEETLEKVMLAVELATKREAPERCIEQIGFGWMGHEALGIALYCSVKFPCDCKGGVLAAVNHSGDSDSTGSITGAILGTLLGVGAIPQEWVANVENCSAIRKIAHDMYRAFQAGEGVSLSEYPVD